MTERITVNRNNPRIREHSADPNKKSKRCDNRTYNQRSNVHQITQPISLISSRAPPRQAWTELQAAGAITVNASPFPAFQTTAGHGGNTLAARTDIAGMTKAAQAAVRRAAVFHQAVGMMHGTACAASRLGIILQSTVTIRAPAFSRLNLSQLQSTPRLTELVARYKSGNQNCRRLMFVKQDGEAVQKNDSTLNPSFAKKPHLSERPLEPGRFRAASDPARLAACGGTVLITDTGAMIHLLAAKTANEKAFDLSAAGLAKQGNSLRVFILQMPPPNAAGV